MLKLGPHIRANNSDHNIDNLLFGVDWPCMTWLDNGSEWGRLNTYHANHPRTVITGRIPAIENYYKPRVAVANATDTGTTAADMIINMNAPKYVYWRGDELNNEHEWSAAFHLAFLKRLNELGYKGCGPMYAEGNPHVRRFDGFSDWPYHKDLLAYMNAHPADTLLAVNAYLAGTSLDDIAAHLTRFEDLFDYLDEWGYNNVGLVLGETGDEVPLVSTDSAKKFEHAKLINHVLNQFPRAIGGSLFDFSNLAGVYSYYDSAFLYPFLDWAKAELASGGTTPPVEPSGYPYEAVTTQALNARLGTTDAGYLLKTLPTGTRVKVLSDAGSRVVIEASILESGVKRV